jgi:hypothetical protein
MARAPIGEIDATLLTFKGKSDRPVWGQQFRESAVACQSIAAAHPAILKVGSRLSAATRLSRLLLLNA